MPLDLHKIDDIFNLDEMEIVKIVENARRNKSPSQVAMIAARLMRKIDSDQDDEGISRRIRIASLFRIKHTMLRDAMNVLKLAQKELIAAVDADNISVLTARKFVGCCVTEQRAIAARAARKPRRKRPAADRYEEPVAGPGPAPGGNLLNSAIARGYEAVDCLKRIPKNDRFRERGFQIVTDWIRRNR